ncbi:hypothetical protein [Yunchengibacter salinarum]|uniref:hypothetical protein n=1 Tax=Yunchengibacter salinarum TaxID=3133399 RepID=UPI0035B6831A
MGMGIYFKTILGRLESTLFSAPTLLMAFALLCLSVPASASIPGREASCKYDGFYRAETMVERSPDIAPYLDGEMRPYLRQALLSQRDFHHLLGYYYLKGNVALLTKLLDHFIEYRPAYDYQAYYPRHVVFLFAAADLAGHLPTLRFLDGLFLDELKVPSTIKIAWLFNGLPYSEDSFEDYLNMRILLLSGQPWQDIERRVQYTPLMSLVSDFYPIREKLDNDIFDREKIAARYYQHFAKATFLHATRMAAEGNLFKFGSDRVTYKIEEYFQKRLDQFWGNAYNNLNRAIHEADKSCSPRLKAFYVRVHENIPHMPPDKRAYIREKYDISDAPAEDLEALAAAYARQFFTRKDREYRSY